MDRLHQLFRNIKTIISEINKENRGRPKSRSRGRPFTEKTAIQTILIMLLATIKGWNISQTHRNLTCSDPTWRNMIGIPLSEIPSRRTLNNRWNHPLVRLWQNRIIKRMFKTLLNQRNLYITLIDMSDLPVSLSDTLANWGVCGKGNFYGYKLHLIVSRDGIPLGFVVTKANSRETSVISIMLARVAFALTSENIDNLSFLIGDTAYDSNPSADQVKRILSAQMITPVNPRNSSEYKKIFTPQIKRKLRERGTNRDKAILLYESKYGKRIYNKYRIFIEQVIDQIKNDFGLLPIPKWTRGVRKVRKRVSDKIFAYICMIYCNKLRRRPLHEIAPYIV